MGKTPSKTRPTELIDQTNSALLFLVCSMWDGGMKGVVDLRKNPRGSLCLCPSHSSVFVLTLLVWFLLCLLPFFLIDQKLNIQIVWWGYAAISLLQLFLITRAHFIALLPNRQSSDCIFSEPLSSVDEMQIRSWCPPL